MPMATNNHTTPDLERLARDPVLVAFFARSRLGGDAALVEPARPAPVLEGGAALELVR